ncbi:MAG: hypothetical protein ACRELF_29055, partial [Gemmataceae bacterium]
SKAKDADNNAADAPSADEKKMLDLLKRDFTRRAIGKKLSIKEKEAAADLQQHLAKELAGKKLTKLQRQLVAEEMVKHARALAKLKKEDAEPEAEDLDRMMASLVEAASAKTDPRPQTPDKVAQNPPPGKGRPAHLLYLPADSKIVGGLNLSAAGSDLLTQPLRPIALLAPEVGLILNAEKIFVGGGLAGEPTVVLHMKETQDIEQLRKTLSLGPPQQLQGKTVYRASKDKGTLYMPNPKTVVLLGHVEAEQVLRTETQPLHPEMVEQIDRVKDKAVWAAVRIDDEVRKKLEQTAAGNTQRAAAGFLKTMRSAKGLTVALQPSEGAKSLSVEVGLIGGERASVEELV